MGRVSWDYWLKIKDWQWQYEELQEAGLKKSEAYECIAKSHKVPAGYVAHHLPYHMKNQEVLYDFIPYFLKYVFDDSEEILSSEQITDRIASRHPWKHFPLLNKRLHHAKLYPRPKTVQNMIERYLQLRSEIEGKDLTDRLWEPEVERVSSGKYRLLGIARPSIS